MEILSSKLSVVIPENNPDLPTTGRRLAYARHLTGDRHPLLARVMVNRIWYHHFGRAFVNSLSDFGQLGETNSSSSTGLALSGSLSRVVGISSIFIV